MSTFTVSTTVLTQLLALQQQQMTILQAILTGSAPAAKPAKPAKQSKAASVDGSKASGKGSRGPRGSSGWDLFKKQVRKEMTDASPGVKFTLAEVATECSERKERGDYDEAYWKAQAAAAKLEASGSAAGGDSDAEPPAPKKAVGRPKKEAAAATKPAAKKAVAAPPPPPPSEDEEEIDAEVWEHKGVTYAKASDNAVWAMVDGELGEQVGVYNPLTDSIE